MGSFEAAMQAVVAKGAIAVAIAGFLMKDSGNPGGHLIGSDLVGMGEVLAGELVTAHDWGQLFGGSARVISRNVVEGVRPLSRCGQGQESQSQGAKESFHHDTMIAER